MAGKYILESLKEKFGVTEEEEQEGFPDMNYTIGNSSALDIGEVPTPMSERIGQQTQIGGRVMEVKIANPATFSMKGEDIITTVRDLGIDINLHCDMNVGFASAYKSRGQDGMGFDPAHDYFTRYLQALARFKQEVENRGEGDEPLFRIGRINPHTSTSPMPALSERMAADVGLDPFGFEISDADQHSLDIRNEKGQNMFRNKEFLEKFYHTFLIGEVVDQPWQLYSNFFSRYSDEFQNIWREAQRVAAGQYYHRIQKQENKEKRRNDKIALVSTAARADVGTENAWLDLLKRNFKDEIDEDPIKIQEDIEIQTQLGEQEFSLNENINTLDEVNDLLGVNVRLSRLATLTEAVYNIRNEEFSLSLGGPTGPSIDISERFPEKSERIKKAALKMLEAQLDNLWKGEIKEKSDEDQELFLISVEGKISALTNHLDIDQQQIFQLAQEMEPDDLQEVDKELDEAAIEVLTGESDYNANAENGAFREKKELRREVLRSLSRNFEQELWKESNLFYRIVPAWMSCASEEVEEDGEIVHEGWKAPEFLWKTLIENEYDEVDLSNPDEDGGYFDKLENDKQFQIDVAAAVGACYVWGHFTQRENSFHIKDKKDANDETLVEEDEQEWTWIEWMNKYGIGVNLEAMAGSPQQMFKVWRHKDIALAAHAVNITARNQLEEEGELGGKKEMHEELDGCPVKFTVDMEHVASLGVDPWDEIELLVEQEEELAGSDWKLNIDPDKPLGKIMRQYHLMDPGVEAERGTYHGAFDRGNKLLYRWLYNLVDKGFARNPGEAASIMFELAEHKGESSYMMRITMNMIELGIEPEKVDPANVSPGEDYEDEREALIARFFGIDRASYDKEWAKIEEHAFDPLEGLLEAHNWDYTFSSNAAVQQGENRPNEWKEEEYK